MKFNDGYIPGLAKSAPVERIVADKTEQVARIVRQDAPVDTAEYVGSVRTEIEHTPYRVIGKVIADNDHAMLVEGKHGTLRRALRRVTDG